MTASMHVIDGEREGDRWISVTLPVVELKDRTWSDGQGKHWRDQTRCSCGVLIADGEMVRYRDGRPLHPGCYERAVEAMSVADAWIAIGQDMQRNPSRHSAAAVRATLENLCRLASKGAAAEALGWGDRS